MNSETTHNYEQRLLKRGIRPSPVRMLVMRTLCQATSPLSVLVIVGTCDKFQKRLK